uniref:phosphopyruvate hydratase n=1 Tax=Globisporangium ultimum (strain ATCC 200006 / CBS 805.95 / DAOM BR144) TaxID=431595 RepID=K3WWU0_GLOUD
MARSVESDDVPAQDEAEVRERDIVEAYLSEHALEPSLNDVINQVVAERPADPFLVLSTLLYAKATAKRGIFHVEVREILDGNGVPTVVVRLHTGKGVFEASCSSETRGIPDKADPREDPTEAAVPLAKQRFSGRGYRKQAEKAERVLAEKLLNVEPTDQSAIDSILTVLEPEVGRNVCYATSIAVCQAGAKYAELPLTEYIAKLHDMPLENLCVPMPLFSVVNAGKYASNKLFVQEIFLSPSSAVNFADAYQIGAEFNEALREQLETRGIGFTNVGAFGGFAPQLQTLAEMFQILRMALDATCTKLETGIAMDAASASPLRVDFGVDFSASDFVLLPPASASGDDAAGTSTTKSLLAPSPAEDEPRTSYSYNMDKWVSGSAGSLKSSGELFDIIRSSIRELEITAVVDPFEKEDIKSFSALLSAEHDADDASGVDATDATNLLRKSDLGGDPNCCVQIVGNTLFQFQGLDAIHEERACNTILLQLHQFSTLSRALGAVTDARRLGLSVILGAAAGDPSSEANFLAAFAIGAGIGQVKFGGLCSAECIARYNALLLASEDTFAPAFVASAYRR